MRAGDDTAGGRRAHRPADHEMVLLRGSRARRDHQARAIRGGDPTLDDVTVVDGDIRDRQDARVGGR